MKKLLLPLAISTAVFFTACSNKSDEAARDMIMLNDAMHQNSLNSDTAAIVTLEEEDDVDQAPVELSTPKPVKVKSVKRSNAVRQNPAPVRSNTQSAPPVVIAEPAPAPTQSPAPAETSTEGTSTESDGAGNADAEKATAKKGGLSKAAQGAIIGGVGGAVGGAVIGKNGKGAIIGGVIGAAGGYILGRQKDKKEASTSGN